MIIISVMKSSDLISKVIQKEGYQMDKLALSLAVIGALNWGSIGIFGFDAISWLLGGQGSIVSRIVFTIVGLAGIWCISLLFRDREIIETDM